MKSQIAVSNCTVFYVKVSLVVVLPLHCQVMRDLEVRQQLLLPLIDVVDKLSLPPVTVENVEQLLQLFLCADVADFAVIAFSV